MKKRTGSITRCSHHRAKHPPGKTVLEQLAQRKADKMSRVYYGLKEKILDLMRDMKSAGIKFNRANLRRIGVKGWSGYYSYLKTTALAAVQEEG